VAATAASSGRLRRATKEAGRYPEEERPEVALVVMASAAMGRKREGRRVAVAILGLGSDRS
jgi:hypothetical protein